LNKLFGNSKAIGKALFAGVIIILLVAMVAVGFVMSNTIDSLQTEKTSLQTQFTALQANNSQLQSNYSSLQTNNNNLQGEYNHLQSQYSTLQSNNSQLQGQIASLQGQIATLQSQLSTLQTSNSQLQSNYTNIQLLNTNLQTLISNLQTQTGSLQSQLSNATALIAQLQGQTGIQATYMDLHYVAPTGLTSYYFLQLSLKNTGTVPITQIFVTLNSVQISMTFTYLNSTVNAETPLPSYQTTSAGQNVTPPINNIGTYPLVIQAIAANSTIYTYQTTITAHV
jgi:predicted nuclease with TOPRIM domain